MRFLAKNALGIFISGASTLFLNLRTMVLYCYFQCIKASDYTWVFFVCCLLILILCDRFGHMKRVMSMVLFKGFLVWCTFFSLVTQTRRFLVFLDQECPLRWVCSFRNSHLLKVMFWHYVFIIIILIFWCSESEKFRTTDI
jgi:hypothetical protein